MKVSFSPPQITTSVISEVVDVLNSGWITSGPKVKDLELQISDYTQSQGTVCVNSWTSGAQIVLHWLGVGAGDEVIIPAYTYAATALAVLHCGAIPVMVDTNNSFLIDVVEVSKKITPRTKAIIAVDFGGFPADYSAIWTLINSNEVKTIFQPESEVQRRFGRIALISDAAHSFGCRINGVTRRTTVDLVIYSFHAVKNITSAEGGAICFYLPDCFNCAHVIDEFRLLRLNGQTKDAYAKSNGNWEYDIVNLGFKCNMPDVLAAIALAQLKDYEQTLLKRKSIFERYNELLARTDFAILPVGLDLLSSTESSYHLYPLRINDFNEIQRSELINYLLNVGVSTNVHFKPLPMLSLFKNLGYRIDEFPISLRNYSSEISLPIYPQMEMSTVDFVVESLVNGVKHVMLIK